MPYEYYHIILTQKEYSHYKVETYAYGDKLKQDLRTFNYTLV